MWRRKCTRHWKKFKPGCPLWLQRSPAAAAASLQSCPTLCDPVDGSPPGFPSLGFSRQEHWSGLPFPSPMHEVKSESEVAQSCLTLVTPWTAAYQAPPSMGFSRQKYWSGVPLPSPQRSPDRGFMEKCRNTEQERGIKGQWGRNLFHKRLL